MHDLGYRGGIVSGFNIKYSSAKVRGDMLRDLPRKYN